MPIHHIRAKSSENQPYTACTRRRRKFDGSPTCPVDFTVPDLNFSSSAAREINDDQDQSDAESRCDLYQLIVEQSISDPFLCSAKSRVKDFFQKFLWPSSVSASLTPLLTAYPFRAISARPTHAPESGVVSFPMNAGRQWGGEHGQTQQRSNRTRYPCSHQGLPGHREPGRSQRHPAGRHHPASQRRGHPEGRAAPCAGFRILKFEE